MTEIKGKRQSIELILPVVVTFAQVIGLVAAGWAAIRSIFL